MHMQPIKTIEANGDIKISEVLEAEKLQWIGYEIVVNGKSFYGVGQCGEYVDEGDSMTEEHEEIMDYEDVEDPDFV